MAYKFQLGKARMSGSLEQEGDISLATGSGADVIGIEASLGSGQYLAQLGYDASTSTGKLEIADGSTGGTVFSVLDVLSGSAMNTLAGSGLAFNQSNGVMSVDIDELSALGGKGVHQTDDHFIFSDAGTEKKITFSNLQDAVFNDVSGDATIADGGALTIANDAISLAKLAGITRGSIIVGDSSGDPSLLAKGSSAQFLQSDGTDPSYVSISGDATVAAGGGLTIANDAVSNAKLANITRGSVKVGGNSDAPTDLDAKSSGYILVGDGTDVNSVAVSGDVTLSAAGQVDIAAAAVHHGMLNDDIISGQSELAHADIQDADDLMIHDATAGAVLKVGVDSLRDHYFGVVSGDASIADGGALTFAPAQTNITSLLATDIKIGEDDNTKIDFETPNEIHFYADSVEQVYVSGGVFAPQTDSAVDLGTSTERFKDAYVDSLTVTNDVTIAGNLTITGATVEVQQAFVVTSSVQFEGITPDGNEIKLTTADPTADRTITLPDLDGHVPLLAGAISNANVTAAEFALLDGGTARGTTTVATGDGFLHNNGGTMRMTSIDKIIDASAGNGLSASGVELSIDMNGMSNRTVVAQGDLITIGANNDSYAAKKISFTNFEDEIFGNVSGDIAIAAGGGATIQANAVEGSMLNTDVISAQTDLASGLASTDELLVSDAGTLKKMDVSVLTTFIGNNASATVQELTNATQTLSVTAGPMVLANRGSAMTITLDSPANHQGKRVIIKKIGAGNVTISANGSENIDGQGLDIVLESPMAAVTIISDGSNYFIV
jgi:hypothetical protein